jgi:outer membrane protein OmpA-like peptidoglycan-associated protein
MKIIVRAFLVAQALLLLNGAQAYAQTQPAKAQPAAQAAQPAVSTQKAAQQEDAAPPMGAGTGYFGETGLWRITSAEPLKAFSAHIGAHGEYFYYNGFIFPGDTNQRGAADFALGIVPADNLEIFFMYQAIAAYNNKTVPTYQLSLGGIVLGLKYAYPFVKSFSAGVSLAAGFNSGPGDKFINISATAYNVKAIATFDARKLAKPFPVRLHVNAGAYLIFPDKAFRDSFKSYEHYMLNVNLQNQGVFGGAMDFPIDSIGFMPFVEASIAYPDGPSYITPGFKWRPSRHYDFTLDLYCDIGLLRGTPASAPNTQYYNVIAGISMGLAPFSKSKELVVERIIEKVPEKAATGLIKGLVVDSANETPVGNAIIAIPGAGVTNLSTDPLRGDFLTQPLKPGPYTIVVERDGFEPGSAKAEVKAGQTTPVKISVFRKVVEGEAIIRVIDSANKPIETAEVQGLSGAKVVDFKPRKDEPGRYAGKLEAGKWYIVAKAEGKLSIGRLMEVSALKTVEGEIQLKDKPKEQFITVEKDRIVLLKKIHFETNSASITGGDSYAILDMILDAINNNPKLKKVKIEGHTDDKGPRDLNIKLSKDRANAVRDYLIRWGIKPEMLEAEGYGPDRPIESNKTNRGREANRRVEFILVEQ